MSTSASLASGSKGSFLIPRDVTKTGKLAPDIWLVGTVVRIRQFTTNDRQENQPGKPFRLLGWCHDFSACVRCSIVAILSWTVLCFKYMCLQIDPRKMSLTGDAIGQYYKDFAVNGVAALDRSSEQADTCLRSVRLHSTINLFMLD